MTYRDDLESRVSRLEKAAPRLRWCWLSWDRLALLATLLIIVSTAALAIHFGVQDMPETNNYRDSYLADDTAVACHAVCVAAGHRGIRYDLVQSRLGASGCGADGTSPVCVCGAPSGLVLLDLFGQPITIGYDRDGPGIFRPAEED